jgi:hypothetical protein
MSNRTRKRTIHEIAMKHGSRGSIPADDPIYKQGWTIGSTVPYRQRPAGLPPSGAEISSDSMRPALDQIERALKAKDARYMAASKRAHTARHKSADRE